MTPRLRVHPDAEAEFLDAVRHYETTAPGLGEAFDGAIAKAVDDVRWNPDAWPPFPDWDRLPVVRSRTVETFPYRIVYVVHQDEVIIVAFAHRSRRPGYWDDRVV